MKTQERDWLSIEEFAAMFGVSETTVYRGIRAQQVPAAKVVGQWRINAPAYIESLGVLPKAS